MAASVEQLTENLADVEARNRAILDAAVDSIVTIDETGLIQSLNAATVKMFGYDSAELVGRNISTLMPEPFSSEHDQYLARYLKTGVRRIIGIGREVIGKRKSGSTFPMDLSVSEVKLTGRRLFTGILRDITYRKQVEEALLSERNRFERYLDTAEVIIVSLDRKGKIQLVNHRALELLDKSEEQLIGTSFEELFPNETEFLNGLRCALQSNAATHWESPLPTPRNRYVISWHSSPLGPHIDDVNGVLLSGSDITERVRAQTIINEAREELEKRVEERTRELTDTNERLRGEVAVRLASEARLASSLKEKEVLLKEIHHRVKNNLQLITSLLSLQVQSRKGMTVEQLVYEIQGRIQSIALLHEMLYQSGDLVHVDFQKYIETLAQTIVRYHGMSSRVILHSEVEAIRLSLDGSIYCGLLLNELITNALKHGFPGGRNGNLAISAKRLNGNQVVLSVRDDGVGFKEDFDIAKMTSLGLELVQQLTNKLHGALKISNDNGAIFELIFKDEM